MRVVGWVRIIIQATVWKLIRDLNWRSTSQSHQIVTLTTVISSLTTASSSTALHDSTRLLSKTSGHCFETNDAEFQSEDGDTAT